jgi:CHAT domain-containing protein/tetratricopeptide (TPR) repeat protein
VKHLVAGLLGLLACSDSQVQSARVESVDLTAARAQPDSVRSRIAQSLRLASTSDAGGLRAGHLVRARALARAYAVAWNDSFLVRRVAMFEAASLAARRSLVIADSLRDAGKVVIGQKGVPAAMELWRESLHRAEAAGDVAGEASTLANIGAGLYTNGQLDSATSVLTHAHELAREVGDLRTMGNTLGNLASVSKDRGDLSRAAQLYSQASAIRRRSGDSRGLAADENNLGLIARELGDLGQARASFEKALALNRSEGRSRLVALNLDNLGDVASIAGDYATAQRYYDEALGLNRSAGDDAESAFVLHDLGLLAARRGDYPRALAALSVALAIHERSGAVVDAIAVRTDLAIVQAATGDLQSATETLSRAQRAAVVASEPKTVQAQLALARADLAVQLGALAEADAEYARAEELSRELRDDAGRAEAQQGRGLLLLLREDHAGALQLLQFAARSHADAGDTRSAARVKLLIAAVQREMGDTAAARLTLTSAHQRFTSLGDLAGEVAATSALGDLALRHGSVLGAERLYRRGLDRIGDRRVPDLRWRLHAGLAEALLGRAALGPAAEELRAAVGDIEQVAGGLRVDERRVGFLSDKWQVYGRLAAVERERGALAEAFRISERMRARQMLAMLARGRVATARGASAQEQDLRRHIDELTQELATAEPNDKDRRERSLSERSVDAPREALAAAQRTYADLLLELRTSEPAYARMVSAEPIGWKEAAARLQPDMAILEYLLTDSVSTLFVVTADTVVAVDLNVGRQTLADLVDFSRRAMDRPERASENPLWRSPLRRLYQHLIEPAERTGQLRDKRLLLIVPDAELHFLPFGALLAPGASDRFLVERYELAYAPSASVWVRLGERTTRAGDRRVLALAPHPERLPASADEVAAIRAVFGRRATLLVGAAASERALRAASSRNDILHLATYGVLNKHNPLFSYVELASSVRGDGRLEVHEVFDLDLDGQLVVLSACQTALASGALADVPPGNDWVGLIQSFLQAGAGSVLASLWPIEDRATAQLMQHFYKEVNAGLPTAAALAQAQRALLRDASTAHPFYWAGFVLTGAKR